MGGAGGGGLGDDSQGALRADEELLEIVAGVVLAEGGERVEDAAVGEDGLDAQDGAVQAAVAQQAQPAGVGGDVAADLAAALGAEVERHGEAAGLEEGVEGLQDAAGLADQHAADGVEGEDAVEEGGREDDFVADWDAAADEAGVSALGAGR